MNEIIATVWKKTVLIICLILLAAQVFYAQSGWKTVSSGGTGDLITVYFTSAERGFVAGDNGYLARTDDGGETWTRQNIGTSEDINEIYFRNDDNGYVVASKKLFLTGDGGGSWREIKIYEQKDFRNGTPEFLSVRFADKKRGLIVGSVIKRVGDEDQVIDSLVMRTDNGGETWARIIVPAKVELYHLDLVNSSRGWIVGDKGLILSTNDGGVNWRVQPSGTTRALYNIDFRDSEEGYAVGSKGTILRTENGGEIWQTVKTNFPNTFKRVDFADDKNGWIVGFKGTILRSSDRGKTWIKQESSTEEEFYGLFMEKKYGWAVGAKGSIVQYQR